MPNGPRIRANNVYGVISDSPLTAASGTFNSVSLPLLPIVSAAHAIVVFDPKRVYGDPEIVVVTAHTVASTVATILRGQYGTSPRSHPQGTAWAHVPVNDDWTQIATSTVRPTDPYRGQQIFEYDTNRYTGRSTADTWQQLGLFFDPPSCQVKRVAAGTHTLNGNWQAITWDTEDFDSGGMVDITNFPTRLSIQTTGIYLLNGLFEFAGNATGRRFIGFGVNGVAPAGGFYSGSETDHLTTSGVGLALTKMIKLTAGTYIELMGFQSSGGNLAYTTGTIAGAVTWIGRGN